MLSEAAPVPTVPMASSFTGIDLEVPGLVFQQAVEGVPAIPAVIIARGEAAVDVVVVRLVDIGHYREGLDLVAVQGQVRRVDRVGDLVFEDAGSVRRVPARPSAP